MNMKKMLLLTVMLCLFALPALAGAGMMALRTKA